MLEKIRNIELSRGMLIYLISVTGTAMLAVILLFLFWHKPALPDHLTGAGNSLQRDDFPYNRLMVPVEKLQLFPTDPVLIRERRSAWTDEEISRYWIPLEPVVSDLLAKENEKLLDDIFADVP